jgi:Cu2+-exporting ATPase
LPVSVGEETDEPVFCCAGCESVHRAIHESGFDDFYDLQSTGRGGDPEARPDDGDREFESFDSPAFLDHHADALEGGGYEIELHLDGVHCAGCVWIVEQMPDRLDGVEQARLNLSRARLTLRWHQDEVALSKIAAWLERFGYSAHPTGHRGDDATSEAERQLLRKMGACWAIAANVMMLAFAFYSGLESGARAGLFDAVRGASLLLATISVVYGGSIFFRRAWSSLRPLLEAPSSFRWDRLSIDIPISAAILGGFTHSAIATFRGSGEVWFDSITVLIAALLTARWLQIRGRRLAGDAADRLLSVLPTGARRLDDDGAFESVPTDALQPGDVVEVRGSEVVPADGTIVEGETALHRGVLTGESRPERVESGARVFAGAKNTGEPIRLRVDSAGDESRIGRLLDWIEDRAEERAPVVHLADRWAGVFVLAVLGGGLLTWFGWTLAGSPHAVEHAVALLVISCPCALGMATPLAMTTGVGRAARRGIFIEDEGILQRIEHLDEIILDKTGTLTTGEMELVESVGSTQALEWTAALEAESTHPIAFALRAWSSDDTEFEVEGLEEEPGRGVHGYVEGQRVVAGRPDWIRETCDGDVDDSIESFLTETLEAAHTPILVAVDGSIEAAAAFGDPIRPESAELIEQLRARGIEPTVLSGDHSDVVEAVGRQLGLDPDRLHGDVTPEEKRDFVEARTADDERVFADDDVPCVAMVGDGVNDAAALEVADVGIAVEGSASASLVAADVFLTREGLEPIAELVEGSEGVMYAVRRNLAMSAIYNVAGIAVAAAGLVSPLVAAVAMPTSSVAVVISSILQRSFEESGDEGGRALSTTSAPDVDDPSLSDEGARRDEVRLDEFKPTPSGR